MRGSKAPIFAILVVAATAGRLAAQTVAPGLTPVPAESFLPAPLANAPSIELPTTRADDEADIESPGPDMGDFPNSAFTLPKGSVYLESAPFSYAAADQYNAASYSWPFLFRYGVADDVEFRLFGNGGTTVFDEPSAQSGFSPLILDTKIHLWDGNERWIPAASFEAYLTTDWGSESLDGGWQPSLNMNFDLPVTKKLNLECSLGYSGVRDAVVVATNERFIPRHGHTNQTLQLEGLDTYQFSVQWAVEQQMTDRFELFVHGYYAGAVFLKQGSGTVVGAGGFYQFTKRLMGFGSCNAGLDDNVAPVAGQFGLAYAL